MLAKNGGTSGRPTVGRSNLGEDSISEESHLTEMTGRPEIDAISTISYDLQARRLPGCDNILDSEVKGMEKFAKMNVPQSHITSGRKNAAPGDKVPGSVIS